MKSYPKSFRPKRSFVKSVPGRVGRRKRGWRDQILGVALLVVDIVVVVVVEVAEIDALDPPLLDVVLDVALQGRVVGSLLQHVVLVLVLQ
jgi:hypothetical protein